MNGVRSPLYQFLLLKIVYDSVTTLLFSAQIFHNTGKFHKPRSFNNGLVMFNQLCIKNWN